jgi:8-oxo-dGTP pyrophosphatase MutT (NUDIX family)
MSEKGCGARPISDMCAEGSGSRSGAHMSGEEGGAAPRIPGVPPVPQTPAEAAPTRLAATVVLLRDGADGPEVLLLRRHSRSGFVPRMWVFPGGVVDEADAAVPDGTWVGIDPAALADRFGLPGGTVLALHVAAVRETFEEAGVLLATSRDGGPPSVDAEELAAARAQMNDRAAGLDWGRFCAEHGLVMDLGAVAYLTHWVTPIQEPRRYDTRFFAAALPAGSVARQDDVETTSARWLTPRRAVEDPDVEVIFPTERTLRSLEGFATAAEVLAHARALPDVPTVQPHILHDEAGDLVDIVLPDDPRYPHELYRVGR